MSSGPGVDEIGQRLSVDQVGLYGDAVRVTVTGDLDVTTVAVFHRRLSGILGGRPALCLELDLSGLEFCDLAGLRALETLGRTANRVRIVAAGPALDLLLTLSRTTTLLGHTPPPGRR